MAKQKKSKNGHVFTKVFNTMIQDGLLAQLSGTHLKLLIALCSYMDDNGVCYPSEERLAKDIGKTKKHVQKYLTSEEHGLIYFRYKKDENDKTDPGQPIVSIVEKRKSKLGNKEYNVYQIHKDVARVDKYVKPGKKQPSIPVVPKQEPQEYAPEDVDRMLKALGGDVDK